MKIWLDSFEVDGRQDCILASKLKALKGKLKEWNLTKHGNLEVNTINILNQISELDLIQEYMCLNEEEAQLKTILFMEFEEVEKIKRLQKKIAWRQRSRALWLKEGDRNTKFFKRTANAHKRYNNIDQLVVNGIKLEDPIAIKWEIVRFYQQLFTESEAWRPNFNMIDGPEITEQEKEWLQRTFEEQEVHECIKFCTIDKSLGPDGFRMGFYSKC